MSMLSDDEERNPLDDSDETGCVSVYVYCVVVVSSAASCLVVFTVTAVKVTCSSL